MRDGGRHQEEDVVAGEMIIDEAGERMAAMVAVRRTHD
jgi:hypothetical protein